MEFVKSEAVMAVTDQVAAVFDDSVKNKDLRRLIQCIIDHEKETKDPNAPLPLKNAVRALRNTEGVRDSINLPNDIDIEYRAQLVLQALGEHNVLEIVPGVRVRNAGVLLQQRGLRFVWEKILKEQERSYSHNPNPYHTSSNNSSR